MTADARLVVGCRQVLVRLDRVVDIGMVSVCVDVRLVSVCVDVRWMMGVYCAVGQDTSYHP